MSDTTALARVLDRKNIDYTVVSDSEADVFAQVKVSNLSDLMEEEGGEIYTMQERDESLESYYLSLIGGQSETKGVRS